MEDQLNEEVRTLQAAVADKQSVIAQLELEALSFTEAAETLQDEVVKLRELVQASSEEAERLAVRCASAEGQAGGYKQAAEDLAERLHLAEKERDERAIDEEWRAKRIEIQKLRDKCEQMRKNLIAVDARADERAAYRVAAIYEESKRKIAEADDKASERIAATVGTTGRRIREIEAEANERIAKAEAESAEARKIAADAEQRIAVAERKTEMVRLASIHRVDALHLATRAIFSWEARDQKALAEIGAKSVNDVLRVVKDIVCKATVVAK